MTKRQTISKYISVYWEYKSLKDIKTDIDKLTGEYGEDTEFRVVDEYCSSNLYVVAKVPETDEQMEARIKKEEDQKTTREKYEKQELAKLIKKYGNPSAGTNKE